MALVTALASTVTLTIPAPAQASGLRAGGQEVSRGTLLNAGFEDGLTGWQVTDTASTSGAPTSARQEDGGRGGPDSGRLSHRAGLPYDVVTSQRTGSLTAGWWTLSAWVRSGGGIDTTTLRLSGCTAGAAAVRTVPVTEQDEQWVRLAVSANVRAGRCSVQVRTVGLAGSWADVDDVAITPGRISRTVRGVDLSGLAKNEDHGATYANAAGQGRDPVRLLARAGANVGRLKVWVNPADGYNDTRHVVAMARRIKAAGMKLLVDFHYSDRWADPGAQAPPAAWKTYDAPQMAAAVGAHTRSVLVALKSARLSADFVQVGNEINPGLLHPLGQTYDVDPTDAVDGAQWDNVAAFLTAGATAAKSVDRRTQVLLHLTNINNGVGGLTWWLDAVTARQVPFDLIGLSYYGYWHGSLADLQNATTILSSRYDKDVAVLETAYPWTLQDDPATPYENILDQPSELVRGYPATPAGQAANFRAVQDVVVSAPGGRGLGAVYWEPAWTSVAGAGWDPADPASGNAWDNQAMFDHAGRLLPASNELAPDSGR